MYCIYYITKQDMCCTCSIQFNCRAQKKHGNNLSCYTCLYSIFVSSFFPSPTFRTAFMKSSLTTKSRSARMANMPTTWQSLKYHTTYYSRSDNEIQPASVQTFLRSAPLNSSESLTTASKSKEDSCFYLCIHEDDLFEGHVPISPCFVIGAAWIFRISSRACSFGSGISEEYIYGYDIAMTAQIIDKTSNCTGRQQQRQTGNHTARQTARHTE